ncbi:MAG: rod shape-determining protein MreC [bacterium]
MTRPRTIARWLVTLFLVFVTIAFSGLFPRRWLEFLFLPVVRQLAYPQVGRLETVLPLLVIQQVNESTDRLRLEEENIRLKTIINWKKQEKRQTVSGELLRLAIDDDQLQVAVISIGSKHGVQKGNVVVTPEGWVVGRISKASDYQSEVVLVTDRRFSLPARVLKNDKANGLLFGAASQAAVLEYVPLESIVTVGDIVVTGNLDPAVPPGLSIGTVSSSGKNPNGLFQTIGVTPFGVLGSLTLVTVIMP